MCGLGRSRVYRGWGFVICGFVFGVVFLKFCSSVVFVGGRGLGLWGVGLVFFGVWVK